MLTIAGARIVDPYNGVDRIDDLHVADGRIVALGAPPPGFLAERRVAGQGRVVAPGLFDLAARLREPGFEYKATLESEMAAAVAGGVTALVCPPDTEPALDEPGLIEMLKHRARSLALAHLYPLGALTVGLAGSQLTEMAELTEAGCIGFSQAATPIVDTQVLLRAMQYARTYDYTIWLQPIDPYLGRGGVAHSGAVATRLGLPGVPVQAETVALLTIFELVKATGCRVHLCRLSSAAGIELVRAAKAAGLPVTADVAVHHLHLIDVDIGYFDARLRVDPPFRSQRDRDAIRAGLADGTIDAICSDHTPVADDAKLLPFGEAEPGVTGLELLLPLVLKWAGEERIGLLDALARVTRAPAAIAAGAAPDRAMAAAERIALAIDPARPLAPTPRGLAAGAVADLCLFDPQLPWRVDDHSLVSQGKDTPYHGRELVGRALLTLVAGRVVHDRDA
ncbi:MAG: dihydroorotase [Lautropia sp.]